MTAGADATEKLVVDGSHGEGGGQIVRSALTLSLLTGRAVRLENVRAGRRRPGLAAQHLTAVRAAAAVSGAEVDGDRLGSEAVTFAPGPLRAGDHAFDVAAAREGGSAGAATLVVQTVLFPLALADGPSTVTVRGGTHMEWSPPFDYLTAVWGPALETLGLEVGFELARFGFYPVGEGEVRASVRGRGAGFRPNSLQRAERGALLELGGRAVAAELPSHVPQRMADRARALLREEMAAELAAELAAGAAGGAVSAPAVQPQRVRAACPGAVTFLAARYAGGSAGFVAHGRPGKPSEVVAEEAVEALLAFHRSGAAVDAHLADQLLVPLALASGPSSFVAQRATEHLATQAWLVERFGVARVGIDERGDGTARVVVEPVGG